MNGGGGPTTRRRELIRRAQRGDQHAYEELVPAYQGIAFRTAYVIARNAADAEEAAQDGFVKASRALGRFREGAPFRPWLPRIVANEASNRRRSAGRRASVLKFFHIGSVSVEQVQTLPPVQTRPVSTGLGPRRFRSRR